MEKREYKKCLCKKCGDEGEVTIYHLLEDRERVKDGSVFQWKCPGCGYQYRFIYPCLYVSAEGKFSVRYKGGGDGFDFGIDLVGYEKRDCGSVEELSEKVRIMDAGLDDRVMELVKLLTFAKLHLEDDTLERIYFFQVNERDNLVFTIFNGEGPDGIEIPRQVYENITELAKVLPELSNDFHVIDLEWAGRQVVDSE